MIQITIFQDREKNYKGFHCIGHAAYAEAGEDIVCAAVSVLVINTLNAIEAYTDEQPSLVTDQKKGLIDVSFSSPVGHDARLLLQTMILGLQDIQNNYGTEYSFLNFKEV